MCVCATTGQGPVECSVLIVNEIMVESPHVDKKGKLGLKFIDHVDVEYDSRFFKLLFSIVSLGHYHSYSFGCCCLVSPVRMATRKPLIST